MVIAPNTKRRSLEWRSMEFYSWENFEQTTNKTNRSDQVKCNSTDCNLSGYLTLYTNAASRKMTILNDFFLILR